MTEEHTSDGTDYIGPYLSAAIFCEKVLSEKDNVLSAMRIIDRITLTVSGDAPPAKMPPTNVSVTALISFKSGEHRGSAEVKFVGRNPDHKVFATSVLPILLEGDERGSNSIVNLNMQVNQEGLYWFDVLIGERLLTRMPLRIVYQRLVSGPGSGGLTRTQ